MPVMVVTCWQVFAAPAVTLRKGIFGASGRERFEEADLNSFRMPKSFGNHLIFFVHHPGTFVHRFKNRFLCPPFSMFTTLGANSCRLVILNAPIGVQGHGDKKNIIHSLSMQSRMFFGEE